MSQNQNVQTLLNRYSLAYDSADLTTMANCFTDAAVFSMKLPDGDPVVFEGKETIMKLMTDSMASQTDQRRHVNSNLIVDDSDANVIRTTHYLTLLSTENGAIELLSAGVYSCDIVDEGGSLRFCKLHLDLDKSY